MVKLIKANLEDCGLIHRMQAQAFEGLYEKYQDVNSPAVEPLERIVEKLRQTSTDYYLIQAENETVGAIRIVRMQNHQCRIAPIFILPSFQGKGYAQQAMRCAESLYPTAQRWVLDTIQQETRLCHLYEKLGYHPTGKEEQIQENMTIVYYEKQCFANA